MDNNDKTPPSAYELLKDVMKNDTISLEQIKESWEIAGFIAKKQQALQEELQGYTEEIIASRATLKELRAQENALKENIKKLESKECKANEELAKLRDSIHIQTLINNNKKAQFELQESQKNILPGGLKSVQIYLKDGSIAKAKPAQKIFSEDMYKKYRVALKENRTLKIRTAELELENKRLQIELRDFYSDLALEGMGAVDSSKIAESNANASKQSTLHKNKDFQHLLNNITKNHK